MTNAPASPDSKTTISFGLLRLAHIFIAASVTASGAYVSGAGKRLSIILGAGGALLAAGKYVFDILTDHTHRTANSGSSSKQSPQGGRLSGPTATVHAAIVSLVASVLVLSCFSMESFSSWAGILILSFVLAVSLVRGALTRALASGLIMALFFLMGAASGTITREIVLYAGAILCAVASFEALAGIRSLPRDQASPLETLAKKHGVPVTVVIAVVLMVAAAGCAIGAAFVKGLQH